MTRALATALLVVLAAGAAGAAGAVDGTPPLITFELVGTQGANGWFVGPATVRWRFEDPESGIKASAGCDASTVTSDTAGTRLTCTATNLIDVTSSASVTVKVDRTPPAVTGATADRAPDSAGWYTRPVTFAFSGADATSGVAGCVSVAYPGPDHGAATVAGTCTDVAGNVSQPGRAEFRYDATAPSVRGVAARAGDGEVTVQWTALPQWEWVEVTRTASGAPRVVYRGTAARVVDRSVRNGVEYRYAVVGRDEAGHATSVVVEAMPLGPLRTPVPGATVSAPPRLTWRAAAGAVLYNVQLFRGGRKILSAWPRATRLQLARSWRHAGRRYLLSSGTYRWYVWPARRHKGRLTYGRQLGSSSFVVARRS